MYDHFLSDDRDIQGVLRLIKQNSTIIRSACLPLSATLGPRPPSPDERRFFLQRQPNFIPDRYQPQNDRHADAGNNRRDIVARCGNDQ